jgi:glycosyltransferase involved in cell wall biosynthesis
LTTRPSSASILVNNFNYARYLGRAIESALTQSYQPIEVIVVDDGSTDDSASVVSSFGADVTAILQPTSKGQAAAINTAFRVSKGEVVFVLDSDDQFKPEKVSRVMVVFRDHPEVGSCFHEVDRVRDGVLLPPTHLYATGVRDERRSMIRGRPPFIATPMIGGTFRRTLLEQIMPLPEYPGTGVGDHYLKWAALLLAPTYFLGERLAIQYLHGRNSYTEKHDEHAKAKRELRNAKSLRQRFPESARSCDLLFLHASARVSGSEPDAEVSKLLSEYMSRLPPGERRRLGLRTYFHVRRRRMRRLVKFG